MTSASAALARLLTTMPDPASTAIADEFEAGLADLMGVRFAVAVSSGTAALHAALVACDVGPGDEVLVPAVSVVMSVAPVVYAGARPVFVDAATLPGGAGTDLDYDDLDAKLSDRTRAVLAVHLWGRSSDPRRLAEFCAQHGLRLVEDACQAHGTRVLGRPLGGFGDAGCVSLRDGKVLWSGEGGAVLTDDGALAARCRAFRSHWQTPPPGEAPLARLGHNYRLAEPLAAIAHANLARFDQLLARRRAQARLLADLLAAVPGVEPLQPTQAEDWNGYAGLARVTLDRPRAFNAHLAAAGVPNSVGSFGLRSGDQRAVFAVHDPAPCPVAATTIDSTLAVVLTERDDDARIHRYADTIAREADQWPQR